MGGEAEVAEGAAQSRLESMLIMTTDDPFCDCRAYGNSVIISRAHVTALSRQTRAVRLDGGWILEIGNTANGFLGEPNVGSKGMR